MSDVMFPFHTEQPENANDINEFIPSTSRAAQLKGPANWQNAIFVGDMKSAVRNRQI
jgi:hypothetical protein